MAVARESLRGQASRVHRRERVSHLHEAAEGGEGAEGREGAYGKVPRNRGKNTTLIAST